MFQLRASASFWPAQRQHNCSQRPIGRRSGPLSLSKRAVRAQSYAVDTEVSTSYAVHHVHSRLPIERVALGDNETYIVSYEDGDCAWSVSHDSDIHDVLEKSVKKYKKPVAFVSLGKNDGSGSYNVPTDPSNIWFVRRDTGTTYLGPTCKSDYPFNELNDLSLATKVKCYKAYVLPILLFGSECWSLTKVQSQKLERVHSSCLRSILGVRLSDRHTNEHIRKSCGVATLSAYITANRLRWLGHVGRMEEGRLPHIALFSSLHGDMTRPVGRPRHTWEKCVCADLKVLGQDEGSWEASCQIKSAWRKRLWDLTHPWESQRLVRCRRRTKQAIDKHVERYVVPFSGWEDGGSPVPRWWEPPPAPTRVVLDPAASPPPMCDGSGAGFGF